MNLKPYKGFMFGPRAPSLVKKAVYIFEKQRARCLYKKDKSYKWYGAKGVLVTYSKREFISWYIKEYTSCSFEKPSVGRIDHSKNYSLDNIEMQEHRENSRDGMTRSGQNLKNKKKLSKKIAVYSKDEKVLLAHINGIRECARLFNINVTNIRLILRGKVKNSKKLPFILKECV